MWAGDFEVIENHVNRKTLPDEKGLANNFGENNCFLNVVIQALWHLQPFRSKFLNHQKQASHHHVSEDCVCCALETIFTQYQFSDNAVLPPTALRETLALLFKPVQKFQLKQLDDASEALEAVLDRLHSQNTGEGVENMKNSEDNTYCKEETCIPHKVFGLNVVEQVKCHECGSVSAPVRSSMFTTYTYAASLKSAGMRDSSIDATFCQLLNKANLDHRFCPNKEKCNTLCKVKRQLTRMPEIFSVGVVWETDSPTIQDIAATLQMISLRIDVSNIFNSSDVRVKGENWYKLRGMICYYGKHYIVFLYNERRREWMVYDDVTVKGVGSTWPELQQRMIRGKLQPSVLFYECEKPNEIREIPWRNLVEEETVFAEEKPVETPKEEEKPVEISKEIPEEKEKVEVAILEEKKEEMKEEREIPTEKNISLEPVKKLLELGEKIKEEFNLNHPEIYSQYLEIIKEIPTEGLPSVYHRITELFKDHSHVISEVHSLLSASERNPMAPSINEKMENVPLHSTSFDQNPEDTILDRDRVIVSKMQESVIAFEEPTERDEILNTLGESFVFIPKFSTELEDVDFKVIRTNWLFKKQVRRLRFKSDRFTRVQPGTGEVLETYDYKDVLDITMPNSTNVIIRFYSGKEPQYYECDQRAADIVEVLVTRSGLLGHRPIVKYS